MVFYESPHRISKTVREMLDAWGDRPCVLAREITKKFEEFYRGTLSGLLNKLQQKQAKGEIVLLVAGTGYTSVTWMKTNDANGIQA